MRWLGKTQSGNRTGWQHGMSKKGGDREMRGEIKEKNKIRATGRADVGRVFGKT